MTDAERIQALEDENLLLREALGLTYEPPICLGLTGYESRVVGMLLAAKGVAPYGRLMTGLYAHTPDAAGNEALPVFVTRARHKLRRFGADIVNHPGIGCSLTDETRARLAELR